MAQLVEHILGKDEVPSSNLGSSSKQPRGSKDPRGFGFYLDSLHSRCIAKGLFGAATRLRGLGFCRKRGIPIEQRERGRIQFAYPDRRSTSLLVSRREWVSSPQANTWVMLSSKQPRGSKDPRGFTPCEQRRLHGGTSFPLRLST